MRNTANLRKAGKIISRVFVSLSVLCVLDVCLFHVVHGTVLLRVGMAFAIAALLVIILTKCSGLSLALLLVGFLVGSVGLEVIIRMSFNLEDAITSGDIRMIERRIRQGADPNSIGSNKQTMLTMTCSYWQPSAGPTKKDFDRRQTRICEMVEILIDNGADVNRQDEFAGRAPLHCAVNEKMPKVIKLLLAKGADANLKDRHGNTSLHLAVTTPLYAYGHDGTISIIQLLIENGADVNAKNNEGHTPLELVASDPYGVYKKMAELLRKYGADE